MISEEVVWISSLLEQLSVLSAPLSSLVHLCRCAAVHLHEPSLLQGIEHPLFLDSPTAPTEDAHETVSPDLPLRPTISSAANPARNRAVHTLTKLGKRERRGPLDCGRSDRYGGNFIRLDEIVSVGARPNLHPPCLLCSQNVAETGSPRGPLRVLTPCDILLSLPDTGRFDRLRPSRFCQMMCRESRNFSA